MSMPDKIDMSLDEIIKLKKKEKSNTKKVTNKVRVFGGKTNVRQYKGKAAGSQIKKRANARTNALKAVQAAKAKLAQAKQQLQQTSQRQKLSRSNAFMAKRGLQTTPTKVPPRRKLQRNFGGMRSDEIAFQNQQRQRQKTRQWRNTNKQQNMPIQQRKGVRQWKNQNQVAPRFQNVQQQRPNFRWKNPKQNTNQYTVQNKRTSFRWSNSPRKSTNMNQSNLAQYQPRQNFIGKRNQNKQQGKRNQNNKQQQLQRNRRQPANQKEMVISIDNKQKRRQQKLKAQITNKAKKTQNTNKWANNNKAAPKQQRRKQQLQKRQQNATREVFW